MKVDDIIQEYARKYKIPGISVGLINEARTSVFNYGEIKKDSGIEPTSDTLYEIGSMTKTFTVILLAQLQNEGLLSIHDPVVKFLPEYLNSEFDKRNITLFHLATHTSGISDAPLKLLLLFLFSIVFRRNVRTNPIYHYNTTDFLQYVSKMKLKKTPGETFMYSNIGFGLIAKIFERVSNSTYEELIKNRICDVLEMKDTGIHIFETHKNRLATGYTVRNKKADYWNKPAIEGAGSLYSTVSDMLKFLKVNLGLSKTNLSPVLEYCQGTRVEPKMPLSMKYFMRLLGVNISKFRLGWLVYSLGNTEILGYDGSTDGFSSCMIMNPEKKSGVVVLSNRALKPVRKLGADLLNEMNGD